MTYNKDHSKTDLIVKDLPIDQEKIGRHKCASCTYKIGYEHGLKRNVDINLNSVLNSIEERQKGERKHRSPIAAYALDYYNSVIDSYE